jgi:hypothetical protein
MSPAYRLGRALSGVPPELFASYAPNPDAGPGKRPLGNNDAVGGGRKKSPSRRRSSVISGFSSDRRGCSGEAVPGVALPGESSGCASSSSGI